jgi:hypothetical protein
MYGSVIIQGIGSPTPAVAPGFIFSQNYANRILFVQVPQSGNGNETPNFSLIAQGYLVGEGTWDMSMFLTEPPSNMFVAPTAPAIASASFVIADAVQHGYVFEADIAVVEGIPQTTSPWTLSIDGTIVASGTCENFPVFDTVVGPSTPTTEVMIRTVAFSFSATSTAPLASTLAYLQIAEAGYGVNMPITTVNSFPNS